MRGSTVAHKEQAEFIAKVVKQYPKFFSNTRVLEIGSLNINGTVRDFFHRCDYIGLDVGPGPGVDLVVSGEKYTSDIPFDVTISAECFEHNPYWAETFINMVKLTRIGGIVLFTCATHGRREHGTRRSLPDASPNTLDWDYYKNLDDSDFRKLIDFDKVFHPYSFEYNNKSKDLYFVGIKHENINSSS